MFDIFSCLGWQKSELLLCCGVKLKKGIRLKFGFLSRNFISSGKYELALFIDLCVYLVRKCVKILNFHGKIVRRMVDSFCFTDQLECNVN